MSYFGMNKVLPKEGRNMSSHTVKVAVSLPKGRFKTLEDIRHKLSISRSALVDEALRFWLESKKKDEMIEKYEKGYLANPETGDELEAFESVQFKAIAKEDW
jgi:metal-responsive CopG/Arc/MetJ family transcriptional regulator